MIRTTTTLDPDVADALKRRARRTGLSFCRNVNEVIRLGLRAEDSRATQAYRIRPVFLGGAVVGIDLDRSLRLSDAIEDGGQGGQLRTP